MSKFSYNIRIINFKDSHPNYKDEFLFSKTHLLIITGGL